MKNGSRKRILHAVNIRVGGGLQVADSIVSQALARKSFDHIFVSPELLNFSSTLTAENVEVVSGRFRALKMFAKVRCTPGDKVVFGVFGPIGVPKVLQGRGVVYVQGFATPWLIPANQWYVDKMPWWKRIDFYFKRFFYRAESDILVCEANYIKQQLGDWPVQFVVAKNGSHQVFRQVASSPTKAASVSTKNLTGLYVAAGYPHKNHAYLYEFAKAASAVLSIPVHFNVTLTDAEYDAIFPQDDREQYVKNIGRVEIAQVPQLYREADFVLVPSLAEASSAVIYEGIEAEKVIFAFDFVFNRELGQDAIVYIDREDLGSAVLKFSTLITDEARVEENLAAMRALKQSYRDHSEERYDRIIEILENV